MKPINNCPFRLRMGDECFFQAVSAGTPGKEDLLILRHHRLIKIHSLNTRTYVHKVAIADTLRRTLGLTYLYGARNWAR